MEHYCLYFDLASASCVGFLASLGYWYGQILLILAVTVYLINFALPVPISQLPRLFLIQWRKDWFDFLILISDLVQPLDLQVFSSSWGFKLLLQSWDCGRLSSCQVCSLAWQVSGFLSVHLVLAGQLMRFVRLLRDSQPCPRIHHLTNQLVLGWPGQFRMRHHCSNPASFAPTQWVRLSHHSSGPPVDSADPALTRLLWLSLWRSHLIAQILPTREPYLCLWCQGRRIESPLLRRGWRWPAQRGVSAQCELILSTGHPRRPWE